MPPKKKKNPKNPNKNPAQLKTVKTNNNQQNQNENQIKNLEQQIIQELENQDVDIKLLEIKQSLSHEIDYRGLTNSQIEKIYKKFKQSLNLLEKQNLIQLAINLLQKDYFEDKMFAIFIFQLNLEIINNQTIQQILELIENDYIQASTLIYPIAFRVFEKLVINKPEYLNHIEKFNNLSYFKDEKDLYYVLEKIDDKQQQVTIQKYQDYLQQQNLIINQNNKNNDKNNKKKPKKTKTKRKK
ncbi:Armadillo-type fold [Pseudocohnilembus persalinus]|uniref:Armadillo-type fold n=1 Tax=Pseudocohnilembus persalinus TaxID=266149 RepID=A0A0V0Q8Y2_PSEPJ|nr:Armadillo-type fold [Pseudocohnilembus persalinus]|eukprot:KRW98607.1 Armadillo-type fold [Pseudocohnilembus persalinus]